MRGTETILCAIPRECWANGKVRGDQCELLQRFFRNLITLERRLDKRVAAEDESLRYSRLCDRIEQVALANSLFAPKRGQFAKALRQRRFPALSIGGEYTELLRLVQLRHYDEGPTEQTVTGRMGATVYSPQQLAEHLRLFKSLAQRNDFDAYQAIRHRIWFIKNRVLPAGCGLVEVPDALSLSRREQAIANPRAIDGRSVFERLIAYFRKIPETPRAADTILAEQAVNVVRWQDSDDWTRYRPDNRGALMEDRLRSQIQNAIAGRAPINLGNQRHNMATTILQEFIHEQSNETPALAPVIYDAASPARPFPLRSVKRLPDGWTPNKELHIGLVSMRHLPIDQYIDINWYCNVEVPSKEGLAAADEACHLYSETQLKELLNRSQGQRLRIHLYHSGYVPAVIGFYRAFVTLLAESKAAAGSLQVIPKLKPNDDGGFVEGRPWPE